MDTIDWSFHKSHREAVRRLDAVVRSLPAGSGTFGLSVEQRDASYVTATFDRETDADAFRATVPPALLRTVTQMSDQPPAGRVVWVPTWDAGTYRQMMEALRAALGTVVRLSADPVTSAPPRATRRMNSSSSREAPRGKRPAA